VDFEALQPNEPISKTDLFNPL